MGTIRLACLLCDAEECDGIDEVPADWQDVDEVQSYEDATSEKSLEGQPSSAWWTHIGVCPDCQKIRFSPAESASLAE
jgi:hypothetical protein